MFLWLVADVQRLKKEGPVGKILAGDISPLSVSLASGMISVLLAQALSCVVGLGGLKVGGLSLKVSGSRRY